jgi:hypothetical protein
MRIVLDKNLPAYRKDMEQLKKAVAATAGHPRGVFCFKTFAELNDWKDEYELLRLPPPTPNEKHSVKG